MWIEINRTTDSGRSSSSVIQLGGAVILSHSHTLQNLEPAKTLQTALFEQETKAGLSGVYSMFGPI